MLPPSNGRSIFLFNCHFSYALSYVLGKIFDNNTNKNLAKESKQKIAKNH